MYTEFPKEQILTMLSAASVSAGGLVRITDDTIEIRTDEYYSGVSVHVMSIAPRDTGNAVRIYEAFYSGDSMDSTGEASSDIPVVSWFQVVDFVRLSAHRYGVAMRIQEGVLEQIALDDTLVAFDLRSQMYESLLNHLRTAKDILFDNGMYCPQSLMELIAEYDRMGQNYDDLADIVRNHRRLLSGANRLNAYL